MNTDLIRDVIVDSPLAGHLGMTLEEVAEDRARLGLPFADHNVTIGDTVHGGAIVSLIDAAAAAAAWATDRLPDNLRGSTVSLTVNFLAGARGQSLRADARVLRRGSSICFLEVDVSTDAGTSVARGLVTYKMG